ncbi:MAG TPA: FtsK/SpoIIIE domain-containing protein [Galbitalea sp.]
MQAPRPPEAPVPHRFPLFATLAPVLGSLGLWLVTRSPFALAFAALGPMVALASGVDARVARRRTARREAERFTQDFETTRQAIAAAQEEERLELERRAPGARELFGHLQRAPDRWRGSLAAELLVRIGTGFRRSGVEYGGDVPSADDGGAASTRVRLRELSESAAVLPGAPIAPDARGGVGFAGPAQLALAAQRGAILQLAIALSPASYVVSAPSTAPWAWLDELPHARAPQAGGGVVSFAAAKGSGATDYQHGIAAAVATVAISETVASLPREIAFVIALGGGGQARVIREPGDSRGDGPAPRDNRVIELEFVAEEEAVRVARMLAECASAEGAGPAASRLPELIELAGLLDAGTASTELRGLRCVVGASARGPAFVDLVRDGPHAIVGGTTGSGKSELLLSWVLAMAAERSPAEVTFLFVDFKGGASFDPLLRLQHCVGLITDLDAEESFRALSSLSAELRYRERTLAERGLRSIDDAGDELTFPRLVVVIDEYAALVETHAALHPVFIDIAARGRSLGVHLILCTQRPAGVVRESILANCGLRISLRVNSGADSSAVIGTQEAASLPAHPLGRAFASIAGAPPELLQIAQSSAEDVRSVVARWMGSPPPRRPWCAPLPPVISMSCLAEESPTDDIPFARLDRPELQRQEIARYDPLTQGSMLVIGGAGSGKSALLRVLHTAPSSITRVLVPGGFPAVWDSLADIVNDHAGDDQAAGDDAVAGDGLGPPAVILLDDVDAVISACPEDYQTALLDLLVRALREGPSCGIRIVLTAQRIPGSLQSAAALCGSRILLRMPDRQEHILAGGEAHEFSLKLTPGAGHWRGNRIQVLSSDESDITVPPTRSLPRAREVDVAAVRPLAVISSRPERMAAALRALAPERRVILLGSALPAVGEVQRGAASGRDILVGDPDAWQAHWGAFAALRGRAGLLFDGCALLDLRTLARVRDLPPPFPRGQRTLWLLGTDGSLSRARLVSRLGSAES